MMGLPVRSKNLFLLALAFFITSSHSRAASCTGRGTVIVYGNGMFNSQDDANDSLRTLMDSIKRHHSLDSGKELKEDLAYKRSEPFLEQLANVAAQKGVTEFENFWIWLYSLDSAPEWFKSAIKAETIELLKYSSQNFDELEDHFEGYAKYVRLGYNVVLVSHSQGNLYANQTARALGQYTDLSLTGSIDEKHNKNQAFPKFTDLFANVQVATPVSVTVNGSPWTTFNDDFVMSAVREVFGALPADLTSSGADLPPNGDFLGHDFIKAYMRVGESENKILSDVQSAVTRLHYPIPYFQPAVMIEQERSEDSPFMAQLSFTIYSPRSDSDLRLHEQQRPHPGMVLEKDFVSCFDLPVGDTPIIAETIVYGVKTHTFTFRVWPEGEVDPKKEKPIERQIHASSMDQQFWDVGVIHAKAGSGKEPLDVTVEIYPQPKLRSM